QFRQRGLSEVNKRTKRPVKHFADPCPEDQWVIYEWHPLDLEKQRRSRSDIGLVNFHQSQASIGALGFGRCIKSDF
ncbi:MAG: hypothetical protein AAGH38_01860, partial [Pseudomonadota bacterium]